MCWKKTKTELPKLKGIYKSKIRTFSGSELEMEVDFDGSGFSIIGEVVEWRNLSFEEEFKKTSLNLNQTAKATGLHQSLLRALLRQKLIKGTQSDKGKIWSIPIEEVEKIADKARNYGFLVDRVNT